MLENPGWSTDGRHNRYDEDGDDDEDDDNEDDDDQNYGKGSLRYTIEIEDCSGSYGLLNDPRYKLTTRDQSFEVYYDYDNVLMKDLTTIEVEFAELQ